MQIWSIELILGIRQLGRFAKERDRDAIPTKIVVVCYMKRLVQVPDKVDYESQSIRSCYRIGIRGAQQRDLILQGLGKTTQSARTKFR